MLLHHTYTGSDKVADRRRYSFYRGLFTGDVLNFSKRSPFVKEIMFERIYPSKIILPMKMHYGVPAVPCVRIGDNVGEHNIIFGMLGETLELTVKASNRDCYAKGAYAAAIWLQGKQPGLYSMDDVVGLN